MAIEVCSPRISFSYNLNQREENHYHQRLDSSLLDSGSDFNFSIGNGFVPELPSADELFADGKILPVQIKKQFPTTAGKILHSNTAIPPPPQKITRNNSKKKRLKEFLSMTLDTDESPPLATAKSFWQFKRSSSLNCVSTKSKGLIKSLQFLTRSNSAGSALSPKPTPISTETRIPSLLKQPSLSRKSSMSRSGSRNSSNQKYGNGVRVSPVLNLPHPFVSGASVSFFGFWSIFCSGKVKKKNR